jgi:hypothetical protein
MTDVTLLERLKALVRRSPCGLTDLDLQRLDAIVLHGAHGASDTSRRELTELARLWVRLYSLPSRDAIGDQIRLTIGSILAAEPRSWA